MGFGPSRPGSVAPSTTVAEKNAVLSQITSTQELTSDAKKTLLSQLYGGTILTSDGSRPAANLEYTRLKSLETTVGQTIADATKTNNEKRQVISETFNILQNSVNSRLQPKGGFFGSTSGNTATGGI